MHYFALDTHLAKYRMPREDLSVRFIVGKTCLRRSVGMFQPQRAAARDALKQFAPRAGSSYAAGRNYDPGPNQHGSVSRLSPWIRTRMLPEWEVVETVLEHHSATAAAKYIDEVCWRTYWKGWLQLRPSIWQDFVSAHAQLLDEHRAHVGYRKALEANTGIDCFDAWVNELVETNHLHNHARMWFASIWVHTLKLPWELGADFFLRHLLDGDPASNTLSWRWVAGLHTAGKTYLAGPENIRKYTNGRFAIASKLAQAPIALEQSPLPKPRSLPTLTTPPSGTRLGLLVTEEDLSAPNWIPERCEVHSTRGYFPNAAYSTLGIAAPVVRFREQSVTDACGDQAFNSIEDLQTWIDRDALQGIVLAEPPVGHWDTALDEIRSQIHVPIYTLRHWWDELMHPYATHGFFRFKKAIPKALATLQDTATTV